MDGRIKAFAGGGEYGDGGYNVGYRVGLMGWEKDGKYREGMKVRSLDSTWLSLMVEDHTNTHDIL